MPMTYAQNKKHIQKYAAAHKEEINEYNKQFLRNKYNTDEEFKQQKRAKVLGHYYLKKECKVFLNILL